MNKVVDNALNEMLSMVENIRRNTKLQQVAVTTGVTTELLAVGEGLYKKLQSTQLRYNEIHPDHGTHGQQVAQKRAKLKKLYMEHILGSRARVADEGIKVLLQIDGDRERGVAELHDQIRNFYVTALSSEAAQTALTRAGITRTELEDGYKQVLDIDTKLNDTADERQEFKSVAARMRKELRHLRAWMRSTRGLMEPDLGDEPHLKTLIGITEPAPRKKKAAEEEEAVPE